MTAQLVTSANLAVGSPATMTAPSVPGRPLLANVDGTSGRGPLRRGPLGLATPPLRRTAGPVERARSAARTYDLDQQCATATIGREDGAGAAPPRRRSEVSMQASRVGRVGRVRSQVAMTTRNRDHANHRQNNNVERGAPPAHGTAGPTPQSNWHHMPGSVIHGRYVRRCPARQRAFASATARRVVRSSPSNPTASSRSCTTSARTCP